MMNLLSVHFMWALQDAFNTLVLLAILFGIFCWIDNKINGKNRKDRK